MYSKKRQIAVAGMLALLAMIYCNLLGKHDILISIASVTAVLLMLLCDDRRIRFDKLLLILFLTQLLYVVFGHFVTRDDVFKLIWTPVFGYMFGGLLARSARSREEAFRLALYTIGIVSTLYAVINFALLGVPGSRYVPDLWTGDLIQPTNFNSRAIYVVIILYYVLKYENWQWKAVFSVLTFATVCIAILTMSRTNVYMVFVMAALGIIYTYVTTKGWRKRSFSRKRLFLVGVVLPVAVLLLAVFARRILDAYSGSLMVRTDLNDPLDMSRWQFWLNSIDLLIKNPWGIPDAYYAHNIVLDTGRVSGVIPMFFMLAYLIMTAIVVARLVSINRHNIRKNTLYLLTYVGLMASFMIEPVLEGRPLNYVAFCILMGIMNDELMNATRVEGAKLHELDKTI